ncbi:M48 family metalloprotease [Nocardiopsis alba]|uniref:M48 family metalloprotease n=1 Tax=Nocardiopsis alba TaxID=53437 RepID=UPI0033BF9D6E
MGAIGVALYFLPERLFAVAVALAGRAGLLPLKGHAYCPENARDRVGDISARELREEYLACTDLLYVISTGTWMAAFLLPLMVGVLIYTLYPWRLLRGLAPLIDPEPCQVEYVERELRRALGVQRDRVRLLITPGTAGGARAFGAWGRYWIAIDRRLLPSDRSETRGSVESALIHHEAAHVLNRDVDIAYLTIAVWWGTTLCTLVPTVLTLFDPNTGFVRFTVLLVALTVLLHARSRVLQVREYYADVRAAREPRIAEALLALLPTSPSERTIGVRWWSALSGSHPPSERRVEIIEDPTRLRDAQILDLFYVGCSVGIAYFGFQHLVRATTTELGIEHGWIVENASGVLFGTLTAFVVCTFVWRSVFSPLGDAGGRVRVGAAASVLATGLLVGQVVGPGGLSGSWVYLLEHRPSLAVAFAVLLWGLCAVILYWTRGMAVIWSSRTNRLGPLWACTTVGACMFVFTLTSWFFFVSYMGETEAERPLPLSLFDVVHKSLGDPLWVVAVCLGCVLPLSAWSVRSRRVPERRSESRICPPWVPVACSALTLLGVVIAVAWTLPWTSRLLPDGVDDRPGSLHALWSFLPILVVCLGVLLAIMSVLAWTLGGRGESGRVLQATVVSLFVTSFLLFPAVEVGINVAACVHDFDGAAETCGDHLREAMTVSVGDRLFIGPFVFHLLLVACVPPVLVVSLLRTLVGSRVRTFRRVPGRPRDVLALGAVVALGGASLLAPAPSGEARVRSAVVERRAGESRELNSEETCVAVAAEYRAQIELSSTSVEAAIEMVNILARSTDPVLVAFAEPALEDLLAEGRGEDGQGSAKRSRAAAWHYCSIIHPESQGL